MARRRRKDLRDAHCRLEEVCIFLEEDLHNVTLQEEVAKLEMIVRKGEDYIARGAQIRARLQWLQDGDEGFKFFFNFLKRKVVADRVLGLHRADGSLAEDPTEVKDMFGLHFQNILSPYALTDQVVAARNAYCQVIPRKVSSGEQDKLESDFTKEELFAALSTITEWQITGYGWASL